MAQVQVPPQAPISGASSTAAAVAATGGNIVGGPSQYPSTSLYVGDLEISVTDAQLYDIFSQVGQVVSVRVCRDINSRRSLGYAYVNYSNPVDAQRALDALNFTPLNGKPIRIMYSNRDPSTRRSGAANIFIKNLDKAIDNKALFETFSTFGAILSCKVATDPSGQSKGYGFVQFDQEEAAQTAINKLNGMLLNDKQVYVGPFLRRHERDNTANKTRFNNVFVKNLSESTTEDDLKETFGKYGPITSVVVMREGEKSKCFGFVNFENPDDAAQAVEELNGKKFDDKEWYVGKAQKKSEREIELKGRFERTMEAVDKYQGLNLYLKNLDDSIGDDRLRELFSEYGAITSCKVMRDPNGVSRGSGFVAFSTAEEASRALAEMNGKMVGNKPLYVALAQHKEERRARLQAQFSQMRPVAMPPTVAPRMPMYPPGAPGLGQQLFYGQGPPTIIPPQPGFGYQQQLVPGMRPGAAPMPNFFMPMVQQGQQAQRPGGRRAGAGPVQQPQHPVPMLQQQMLPRGRVYRYPPGRNMPDVPMQGVGGMLSVPYDMGGLPLRDAGMSQPIPISALASALANASPEQQRTMLGESLYPLVDQLEHDNAAKVTGMLLEMDQTEVLHLLESPEALKAKVAEAMEVLRNVAQQQQGKLGSTLKRNTVKVLSYNVWFREDVEVHKRMKALGDLIQHHTPDIICFQEVTPNIYEIFKRSTWWKAYSCSTSQGLATERAYFCMQMSKLPVEGFSCKPFNNSIMGRELCLATVDVGTSRKLVVATSHLESPCPAPPRWDQMYSKERVAQAKESITRLKDSPNVIFCGDMNWDDKLDGPFPFPDGWADAWMKLRPGEDGWTFDTKANQMLSGNMKLQKRLDRFICKLTDFQISSIEMIGMEAIPGLSYCKEKKVRNECKNLVLPVLPSDHYGLLLTISSS